MATATLVPTDDITVTGWTQEDAGAAPIYDQVDEGIAGADATGVLYAGIGTSRRRIILGFTNVPADFDPAAVSAVTCQIRYKQSGRSDDTWADVGNFSLWSSGTVLAGADSGGAQVTLTTAGSVYATTYTNSNAVGCAYISLLQPVAGWNSGELRLDTPLKATVKGADTVDWYIDAIEVVVTYTPTGPAQPPTGNRQMIQLLAH